MIFISFGVWNSIYYKLLYTLSIVSLNGISDLCSFMFNLIQVLLNLFTADQTNEKNKQHGRTVVLFLLLPQLKLCNQYRVVHVVQCTFSYHPLLNYEVWSQSFEYLWRKSLYNCAACQIDRLGDKLATISPGSIKIVGMYVYPNNLERNLKLKVKPFGKSSSSHGRP